LGQWLSRGEGAVGKDCAAALAWYRRAAAQGDERGVLNVAHLLQEAPEGVERDLPRAVGLYRKLAEKGNCCGEYSLGLCYRDGVGMEKNWLPARRWLTKAMRQGLVDARQALLGMTKDLEACQGDSDEANAARQTAGMV
jgi:TPR repeat protein